MATCHIVLGVPRSGTSLVAGILTKLGVNMGDRSIPPNEWNTTGFFQDQDFDTLHHAILGDPPVIAPVDPVKLAAYKALILKKDAPGRPWGFKSPETAFLIWYFLQIHPTVKVIQTSRPWNESVDSWRTRTNWPLDDTIKYLGRYQYMIDASVTQCKLSPLVIRYSDLLADPKRGVESIAQYIGVKPTKDAVSLVDPKLKRF